MHMWKVFLYYLITLVMVTASVADAAELVLLVAGEELGNLEPVGCDTDIGGLARCATLLQELRKQHPAVMNLHVGNILDLPDENSEFLYQIALEAFAVMGYDVVCVGPKDLGLSAMSLQALQSNHPSIQFLCTNLENTQAPMFAKHAICNVRATGKPSRVAVLNLLSEKYQMHIQGANPGMVIQPPRIALAQLKSLLEACSDLILAVVHAPLEEAKALAQTHPWLDVVIVADEVGTPSSLTVGQTLLISNGGKGASPGVLLLALNEASQIRSHRYQSIPLTEEIASDPTIERLLEMFLSLDDGLAADAPTEQAVHLVYFYKRGCQKCERAEKLLGELKQAYSVLVVQPRNVKQHQALLEAMGQLYHIPDVKRLTTPAIFIGDAHFLDGDIDKASLEAAIQQYLPKGVVSRLVEAESHQASAQTHILERFRSFSGFAVAGAGLLDGINPCAFATLVFFISYLSLVGRKRKEIFLAGIAFTFAVFVTYLLLGIGALQFLSFLQSLPFWAQGVYLLAALLMFVIAILSFYDSYLAKQGRIKDIKLQLPRALKLRIHKVIRSRTRTSGIVVGALAIGFAISALELVCTGQVYLPTLTFVWGIPEMRLNALAYLLLYNVMFIVPLLVVFACVSWGVTSAQLGEALQRHLWSVKLCTGLLLLTLAVWLTLAVLL